MISDKDTIETKNNISDFLKFVDDYYIFPICSIYFYHYIIELIE